MKKMTIRQTGKMLADLTLRRFPSKLHKREWMRYEKILMYRSIIS